jgi:hypothetical protein
VRLSPEKGIQWDWAISTLSQKESIAAAQSRSRFAFEVSVRVTRLPSLAWVYALLVVFAFFVGLTTQ